MCCNLKHLQRCDTCYNSIKNSCYGYDQGYDCYENIFNKYFELEEKFTIIQQKLSDSTNATSKCLKDIRSLCEQAIPYESLEEIEEVILRHFG